MTGGGRDPAVGDVQRLIGILNQGRCCPVTPALRAGVIFKPGRIDQIGSQASRWYLA
jgi:hypothetical protein